MATATQEIEGLVSFLSALFPAAHIERQNTPTNPLPDTFVVKLTRTDPEQHQSFTFLTRTWSLLFVAETDLAVFETSDTLRQQIQESKHVLPLGDALPRMRLSPLSHSDIFEYEDGKKGVIFTFTTRTEEHLQEQAGTLIQHVNTRLPQ